MSRELIAKQGRLINHVNREIANGIKMLAMEDDWVSLPHIAENAMQNAIYVLKKNIDDAENFDQEHRLEDQMLSVFQMKLKMLTASVSEYPELIKELQEKIDQK